MSCIICSYEIFCDLGYGKPQLTQFDHNDFVNIGYGCTLGFEKIFNRRFKGKTYRGENTDLEGVFLCHYFKEHQSRYFQLLKENTGKDWYEIQPIELGPLSLRSFEHSGCEYRKYLNLLSGKGKKRYYFENDRELKINH